MDSIIVGIAVAALGALVVSTSWYMIMARFREKAAANSTKPPLWKIGIEYLRSFLTAYIVAHLFINLDVHTAGDAVRHGFWLWLAFPLVLFVGLSVWENLPKRDAVIHSGDWLIKILLIAAILGWWL